MMWFLYSDLNDSTGSFLDAILAGILPPISVKSMLIEISTIAWIRFSLATLSRLVKIFNNYINRYN